jgi:hypothetical protein
MWILKNSKVLLDNLKSRSFSQVSSIKTFDFSAWFLFSGDINTNVDFSDFILAKIY